MIIGVEDKKEIAPPLQLLSNAKLKKILLYLELSSHSWATMDVARNTKSNFLKNAKGDGLRENK